MSQPDMNLLGTAILNGQSAVAAVKAGQKFTAIHFAGLGVSNLGQFGADINGENGAKPVAGVGPATAADGAAVAECQACCDECCDDESDTCDSAEKCLNKAAELHAREKQNVATANPTNGNPVGFSFGPLVFQLVQAALQKLLAKLLADKPLT